MNHPTRYLVTSALPYANGPLHLGHLAGAYLPADIYVRYLRLMGVEVAFICGSDEHGAAITIQAKKENVSPQDIVDKYHELNKKSFQGLGISFDIFHRTSSELHHQTASEFFLTLYEKGVFEEKESEQFYDEDYQQFLADRFISGTCPRCGHAGAYGDQCENCGSTLSPTELINPVSTLSGKTPSLRKTKHWYLPLDRYEEWLKSWIVKGQGRTEEWKRNVMGQCKSWLDDGLQARSITRDLNWGVKVPLEDSGGKVLYVWLDAPIGYISATRQWAAEQGKDWELFWKDEQTKLLHFIGKDNIVFHCIIFPVILKAHGGYILPTNVPANEFMNLEGDKMSTSRNWSVQLHEYLAQFPGKEDVLRYVLCANLPETRDSEFTWKDFQQRNNNELIAALGNFINRVLVLMQKYYDGRVPSKDEQLQVKSADAQPANYAEILAACRKPLLAMTEAIKNYRFRDALRAMMDIAGFGNAFLAANEPWKLIKTAPANVQTIMNLAVQILYILDVAMQPFLPFSSEKLRGMMKLKEAEAGELKRLLELKEGDSPIPAGHQLGKASILFEKIEDEVVEQQVERLGRKHRVQEATQKAEATPLKNEMTFDDFLKLDLRIATVVEAARVPKTDKLLEIKLDIGSETRTVVSGIAGAYRAEELPGKQVLYLANLKARKIRGILSQGMILMAEDGKGGLKLLSPAGHVENGSIVS